ncbi:MAG: hypothetical protein K5622_00840, partial [Endomicrobiaceae bacterium]|nr:hypothetical protein [Endomicrobiaceae bacterium]
IILNYWVFSDNKKEREIAAEMALHAILNNFYDKNAYYFYLFSHLISTNQTEQFETVKSLLLNEKEFIPNVDIYNLIRKYLTDSEKQKLLDKILAVEKNNCHVIAMQYLKEKNYQKAKEYFIKAEEERLLFPDINMYTVYKLIVKKLIDNNIKVICMQYPVRNILPLQQQLKNEPYYNELTFISNEKIFKDTLMNKDYDELFYDQFAGDFGHCTNLGNTMIAKNIVNTLEKILDLKEKSN